LLAELFQLFAHGIGLAEALADFYDGFVEAGAGARDVFLAAAGEQLVDGCGVNASEVPCRRLARRISPSSSVTIR